MARPKLPDELRRSEVLQIRLTQDERALLEEAAEAAGIAITDVIRNAAMERVRAILRRAERKRS